MYVCTRPFEKIEIQEGGEAYFCCPDWLPKPIGNLYEQDLEAVWNSESAREIRRSIFDGSFRFCREAACPFLASKRDWVRPLEEVKAPRIAAALREKKEALGFGPKRVKCSYDRTCNLSCPSCREKVFSASGDADRSRVIETVQSRLYPKLAEIGSLEITGSGDPFASPAFLKLLRMVDPVAHPRLKIGLFTNALLWTPARWAQLANIHPLFIHAHVSIDAAAADTYSLNRRGGRFETLLENLRFIRDLRRAGKLGLLFVNMTVQENNFREMPAFVRLGREFAADRIDFGQLSNWGTFSPEEFARRAVHLPEHPAHGELQEILDDPLLGEKDVFLGNLAPLKPRRGGAGLQLPF